jgi:hypothetical protein
MPVLLLTAAETSKTPFFIIGGALAVYAVILATIGIQRPKFPFSARGERSVILLTVVMVVLAIAAAILTS